VFISSPKGTVTVFHGNAGPAAGREFYLQALAPLNYRVILAEYPGYGGRTGTLIRASWPLPVTTA